MQYDIRDFMAKIYGYASPLLPTSAELFIARIG